MCGFAHKMPRLEKISHKRHEFSSPSRATPTSAQVKKIFTICRANSVRGPDSIKK
jgi:hypothetical protein